MDEKELGDAKINRQIAEGIVAGTSKNSISTITLCGTRDENVRKMFVALVAQSTGSSFRIQPSPFVSR